MTSTSIGSGEVYPGQNLSISQLLNAVEKKLQDACFTGRIATAMNEAEVHLLERNVLRVLGLVRSTKNTFASINRIPPEILSLIAHQCDSDEDLITLTHVCRGWREIFTSHASLWTDLDCAVVDQTRVYLERSKTSPLDIHLNEGDFLNDAFLLTVPHLYRLGSLSLSGSPNDLLRLIHHLGSRSPLLKTLSLIIADDYVDLTLQDSIFGGDLSSLHTLHLDGVITNLAWENVSNLRTFRLCYIPDDEISVTQLLDFFERAPLLHEIRLECAFPDSSDAPLGRVVPLPNLKHLVIIALQPHTLHTVLLNHLLTPTGASISQAFGVMDTQSPIHLHLPKNLKNLNHLSNITSVNFRFDLGPCLLFGGPSGRHKMLCDRDSQVVRIPTSTGHQIFLSLDVLNISTVEKLAIAHWEFATSSSVAVEKSSIYRIFHLMNNLRTLTLTACLNLPFVLALNPKKNTSGMVICPKLEQLIVYIERKDRFCLDELLEMAKERAFHGAKLETITITITSADPLLPVPEVLELKTCVSHVEYRLDNVMPEWDVVSRDVHRTYYEQ